MAHFKAVVAGISTGGLDALKILLPALPAEFPAPLIMVYHQGPRRDRFIVDYLNDLTGMEVREAEEKEAVRPGMVYLAPPNYHLLVEEDQSLALSVESRVSFARPSIDVLFETAAEAYGSELVGLIMTGANHDGSAGLKRIKDKGGLALVQNPLTAEMGRMPQAALDLVEADRILDLEEVGPFLVELFIRNKPGGLG